MSGTLPDRVGWFWTGRPGPVPPPVRPGPRLLASGFPGAPTSLPDHLAQASPPADQARPASAAAMIEEIRRPG